MNALFSRYLTPLTYLMWLLIIIGAVDHFAVGFLPRDIADVTFYAMWPLLAAVWFGHKHLARLKAQSMRDGMKDGV